MRNEVAGVKIQFGKIDKHCDISVGYLQAGNIDSPTKKFNPTVSSDSTNSEKQPTN